MADKIYCYVEGGVVHRVQPLPKNWANVSGFDKMTDLAELRSHGWYPFRKVDIPHNHITHHRLDDVIDIRADEVVYTDQIVAYSEEELAFNAMNDWVSAMYEGDRFENGGIPRAMEDLYDAMDSSAQGKVSSQTRTKIATKKTLRGSRPE